MKKLKRVTILTMHTGVGGIERFVATIANMFSSEYSVEIIANYGKPDDEAFIYNDKISVKYLSPKLPKIVSMRELIVKKEFKAILGELRRRKGLELARKKVLKDVLGELDTDILITERAMYSNFVRKYYKKRETLKIATDHNFPQSKKYIDTLEKSVRGFDFLVVGTEELYSMYRKRERMAEKCIFIANPLNEIPEKKSSLRYKNLVSIGRMTPEKGFDELIEAMSLVHKKLPKVQLFLVGDGPEKEKIKEKIRKYGLQDVIVLPGFVNQAELAKYFYNSALFVMSSHTEAFGLVLSEAMSYGLPCVAFDSASGARAQINTRNGVFVKNRDKDEMAQKIIDLLKNEDALKTLQEGAIDSAQKYSSDEIFKKWKKILN